MLKIIEHVKISAAAVCTPQNQVDIYDNPLIYGGDLKKLRKVVRATGFQKRHILAENSSITAGDLCYRASLELFKNGITKEDIGAIILVTQYPDYFGPATACVLHGKLGLAEDCLAFDVNQGCSGYVYGLLVGASLIQKNSAKKVLLLVGDTPTKSNGSGLNAVDDIPIFGDGGSATILEYDETAHAMIFEMGTRGCDYDVLIMQNGGFRNPCSADLMTEESGFDYGHAMDGLKVFDFTMNIVPPSINHVMQKAQFSDNEVDYYVFHQANKMILEAIAMSAKINVDKVLRSTLSKYGNLSSASIPSVLCDEWEKFNRKKTQIVLSGFGVGLSWGSCAVMLDKPQIFPICYYEDER